MPAFVGSEPLCACNSCKRQGQFRTETWVYTKSTVLFLPLPLCTAQHTTQRQTAGPCRALIQEGMDVPSVLTIAFMLEKMGVEAFIEVGLQQAYRHLGHASLYTNGGLH